MAVEWEITDGIISMRMSGVYDVADIYAGVRAALADPRSEGAIGLLFDVSKSESLKDRQPTDVHAVGYFVATHSDRFQKRVALVGESDFPYGMMRLGGAVLDSQGIANKVFRDAASGRDWLKEQVSPEHEINGV